MLTVKIKRSENSIKGRELTGREPALRCIAGEMDSRGLSCLNELSPRV